MQIVSILYILASLFVYTIRKPEHMAAYTFSYRAYMAYPPAFAGRIGCLGRLYVIFGKKFAIVYIVNKGNTESLSV